MRFTRKKVRRVSVILSVVFFYLATVFYGIALQLFQLGIIGMLYVLSIIVGTVTAASCLVCVYLAMRLVRTKILKETYFFVLLVPLFSVLGYIIFNLGLKIGVPHSLFIVVSIVLATPLSCTFAGYSEKTFWVKLRRLGLNQGITLLTVIFLVSIPIIEILPIVSDVVAVQSYGQVAEVRPPDIVFESGNDTTKVQGQVAQSVFTAEVPVPSDTVFEAKQAVNITNQSPTTFDLKIYLENLSGNLSRVKQLKIFFTLGNGSEFCSLSVNNGNVKYEKVSLRMKSNATIAMGVISLAQNVSSTDITVISLLIRCSEHDLSMNISIDSV